MAITQVRSAQVLNATIVSADLNTEVAGVGIVGGAGTPLALDLNELSAVVVDVSADLVAIEDATDSSTKKESIADIISATAGVGLAATSGVLALDFNELADITIDVAADSITVLDATDSSSKRETVAALMTAVAGNGLGATSGVLAVNVDGSTIEINADTLRVLAAGITNNELALGSVDVDNLSDLRVTEGTGLIADFAAGTVSTDNGTTVTVLSVVAGTTTVADNDTSFVEVDISGTVSNNVVGFTQGRLPLAEVTAVTGDITVVTDKRAWLDIDLGADTTGLTEANFEENEVPVGDLDGVDVTYTLAQTPSPANSLKLYLNGIRQDEGGADDFTLTTNVITFSAAPISTDKILADYRRV